MRGVWAGGLARTLTTRRELGNFSLAAPARRCRCEAVGRRLVVGETAEYTRYDVRPDRRLGKLPDFFYILTFILKNIHVYTLDNLISLLDPFSAPLDAINLGVDIHASLAIKDNTTLMWPSSAL